MKTIYKYELEVTDFQEIELPLHAQILTVQCQNNKPFIWALVNPKNETFSVTIATFGTGHNIHNSELRTYLGTYQLNEGLVFHVFVQ